MDLRPITDKQKAQYNKLVTHVMQSWEWGEFRKEMGLSVLRYGLYEKNKLKTVFQITFHKVPFINKYVGYLPKGPFPDKNFAKALKKIAKDQNCVFIKLEPNIIIPSNDGIQKAESSWIPKTQVRDNNSIDPSFKQSLKPMFSKYNFLLDLTKSEEELLKNMHPKTRYNIRVAEKHGVKVSERTDEKALDIYLDLFFKTTKRQGFAGHNRHYHQTVWKILKDAGIAKLMIATYQEEPLTTWMLFIFKDIIYYTYGGSSTKHKEVMSNNLVCWETIKLGKKLKLKTFDMWGALGPNPDESDPWIGFHNFKKGYGGRLVEYLGAFDLVANWPIYLLFTFIDKLMPLKVLLLKLLKR